MKYEIKLEINTQTLNAYGKYVDYIFIPELNDSIRVIVSKDKVEPWIK